MAIETKPEIFTTDGELPKAYDPKAVEGPVYRWWEASGFFAPPPERPDEPEPFVIILPPPNVTGSLHNGHAMYTVEDVLIRWRRMQGFPTLWLPGADHASIAVHVVVERELAQEGLTRQQLGREAFLERVRTFIHHYGDRILYQLRSLGFSLDWSRYVFTMDPGPAQAVRTVFKRLYDRGLIYRANRMVNWDPVNQTTVSDLEVDQIEEDGQLWYIRYDVEGDSGQSVTVATTRPETMLGDTAVAVNPDDERYRALIGTTLVLPLLGRRIPVVADDHVDAAFGTGAVKVTPAHDWNDYEVGRRHNLEQITIFTPDGRLNDAAGPYAGLTIAEARAQVLADLEARGHLVKTEPHRHAVPHAERGSAILEPMLSMQWWVDMKPLAAPAIAAARDGRIRFVPERFAGDYYRWLEHIQDWCISRQLWWGHQIPVWYAPHGRVIVSEHEYPTADELPADLDPATLVRDPDVLDTWFSSALWPFSTLGWPDDTVDLRRFYPTSVMETGYDIIFFWVARMIFQGLAMLDEVPFHTVYLHGMVRDERGQKMSKTKGNVLDPLALTDTYGTDALRFTLVTMGTPGNDLNLSVDRIEGNRNFANKLWNVARFVLANVTPEEIARDATGAPFPPDAAEMALADRWIISRLHTLEGEVTRLLEGYLLGEAGRQIYDFLWGDLADWYIEAVKPRLQQGADGPVVRQTLVYALERALRLLHPFMPFITETIWQRLPHGGDALMLAPWPVPGPTDAEAEGAFSLLIDLVRAVRAARSEAGVEPATWIAATIAAGAQAEALASQRDVFSRLARVADDQLIIVPSVEMPARATALVVADVVIYLTGMVDVAAERARLLREIEETQGQADRARAQLANAQFVTRAKPEVVQATRDRLATADERVTRLRARLAALASEEGH
ncbi:MAG: valine--tRNA ligase [Thermomicrobia bacterium]|nr:valine--tRNA ligase [Thermomicrobia bacterium]MCA1724693.1 valine--tRNA ligase [Thermomicrobia bacterium]